MRYKPRTMHSGSPWRPARRLLAVFVLSSLGILITDNSVRSQGASAGGPAAILT
jgi:hypothetical protein